MRAALEAKFMQHDKLKRLLLATGDALLIEHTSNDSYWGDGGGNGHGKNMLGRLLMELRSKLFEDNRILLEMGVKYGQGFLFGKPELCGQMEARDSERDINPGRFAAPSDPTIITDAS